jgi:hypothetical protein
MGLLFAIAIRLYIIYHGYLILKAQPSNKAKRKAAERIAEADETEPEPGE